MRLLLAIMVGVAMYLGLHVGVLRKPLTIGYIKSAYDYKIDYAHRVGAARKIVVVGGSSSLFGVRCQTIAAETGIPCVNMAVTAGIGIDLILEKAEAVIAPGDIVVVPLEYDLYETDADTIRNNSLANTYAITFDRGLLARFPPIRVAEAMLAMSLPDAYSSVVEMMLAAQGIGRRFTLAHLTEQGDMSGHTVEKGREYTAYVAGLRGAMPPRLGGPEPEARRLVREFVVRQAGRGVAVFGTYPTTIDDAEAPPSAYDAVAAFWRSAGADFLDLPGRGRYPREEFYDTHYHLAEPYQIQHSRRIAELLGTRAAALP